MKILIFGCGKTTEDLLKLISKDINIIGYSDNNKALHKVYFYGQKVYHPKKIVTLDYDYLIISSMHYNEILKQLTQDLGISREKIILFVGHRCLVDVGVDNDNKLKKLLRESSPKKIAFSLADNKEENKNLLKLYNAAPSYILNKFMVECFNYKEQHHSGVVIHQDLKCMPNYLFSRNIAIWKGFSFEELYQIRDMPGEHILEGAYIYGLDYIILQGDYTKRLPCISWNLKTDELKVLRIPKKVNNNNKLSLEHKFSNTLLYIPSAIYNANNEGFSIDYDYLSTYIREFGKKSEWFKLLKLNLIIVLPSYVISLLECTMESIPNLEFVILKSDKFYNMLEGAAIVVTDNSISNIEYMLFADKLLHLIPDNQKYLMPKQYKLKGHDNSAIAHCVTNIDDMLDLVDNMLQFGDDYACKREVIREKLYFDDNTLLLEEIWSEIDNLLTS